MSVQLKEKPSYQQPSLAIIQVSAVDIITASPNAEEGAEWPKMWE